MKVANVKATCQDDNLSNEKYAKEILNLVSHLHGYIHACVSISPQCPNVWGKMCDWTMVLMLVHPLLDMSDFKDMLTLTLWITSLL
ncbi:putative clathrin assembly protein [Glycine soja]